MENGYLSRAERIRMAREDCRLSLGGKPSQGKEGEEEERRLIEGDLGSGDATIYLSKFQGFVFRVAVAVVLFLCVLFMDKYQIGNEALNRESVKRLLTSSEQAHQVEDRAREWVAKNIKLPEFLKER